MCYLFRIPEAVAAFVGPRCVVQAVAMVKLSKEAKQRLQQLFKGGQFAIRWGFIPLVIYLGQWEKNLGGDGREGSAEAATPFLPVSCRREKRDHAARVSFEAVWSSGVGLT